MEVQCQHVVCNPNEQERTTGYVDQCKADGLIDGFGIIGDTAHQVAGFMFGVVTDWQAVQMLKDLGAQGAQDVLSGPGH